MNLGNKQVRTPLGVIAGALALAMMFVVGGVSAASAAGSDGASAAGQVAKNANGKLKSTIKGKTAGGGTLTGDFTPLKFKNKDGVPMVKGVIDGVITDANGKKSTFTAIRSLELKKVNGQKLAGAAITSQGIAACDILNLVLGPLDLNVLGLQVNLQQVVLDIIAVPGALLGDLLCAVAGLLSGGVLGNLLGQLVGVLNDILAALGLGI